MYREAKGAKAKLEAELLHHEAEGQRPPITEKHGATRHRRHVLATPKHAQESVVPWNGL